MSLHSIAEQEIETHLENVPLVLALVIQTFIQHLHNLNKVIPSSHRVAHQHKYCHHIHVYTH